MCYVHVFSGGLNLNLSRWPCFNAGYKAQYTRACGQTVSAVLPPTGNMHKGDLDLNNCFSVL